MGLGGVRWGGGMWQQWEGGPCQGQLAEQEVDTKVEMTHMGENSPPIHPQAGSVPASKNGQGARERLERTIAGVGWVGE